MRPLFLEFEGLFSYRSKVSIDFQKLTDAGIFGIFGNTGSGKSAILDAITLALYGDVDRITSKIEKVVNLDKRNANVVFEFQTGNDTDTKYRAELSIRLAEDRTISTKRSILKKIQGEVETIVSEKIGTIIGLEFKNFTLSSIIPQGKFAEFLDSTSINKTNILKSIFNLEKFDLGKKINSITKETEIELESINQRLDGLRSFTPEILENTKRDLAETTIQKLMLNDEIEKLGVLLNELKNLKEMHEQKTALETKLRELDSNKPEIDKLRQELEAYEKLYKLFKNDFDNKKLTGNEINSVSTQLVKSNSELESIQNEFNFAEKEFENISKEYSVKDEIIRKRDNLTKVLQIFNLENKLKEFEDSKNRIKVIQEKLVSSLQKLEKEISDLESTKTEKEQLLIDTGSLTELKNSLLNNDKLQ
ncbi:MAG: SMC family ATPase, partial [Ignavibacteriaceae bacterium]|nr:SMC family ATPase [Ignavibacteriaceae bacterium]